MDKRILITFLYLLLATVLFSQAFTTPTRTDVNSTYSITGTVTGTLSGTPAITIAQGFVAASATVKQAVSRSTLIRHPITLNASGGVRDLGRITILVQGIGGTSTTRCVLNWKEIR